MSFWKDKKVIITGGAGFLGSYMGRNYKMDSMEIFLSPSPKWRIMIWLKKSI